MMKLLGTLACAVGTVRALSIIDFDTCSIPYIIPLSFQNACDRSDEYLAPIANTNGKGDYITAIAPPDNITAAGIRTKPNRWTHEPFCIESLEANNGFCVYTNDRFANGRGISIVSTPRDLINLLHASAFKEPNDSEMFRHPEGNVHKQYSQSVPGKGIGMFANATLNRGDYLQGYTPILLFQDDFIQFVKDDDQDLLIKLAIERLPSQRQASFNALAGNFEGNAHVSRIRTNAFQAFVGTAKDHYWAVIPEAARYNHDCRPNAAYYFDHDSLTHRLHAMSKTYPGEEITLTYTHAGMKHAQRQAFIEDGWAFKCTCSKCSAPKSLVTISDYRISLISDIEKKLNDITPNRTATTETAMTLVSLYEQEHLHVQIGDAYMYAALEYAYVGDMERMRRWVVLALEGLALWRGENHQWYRSMLALSIAPQEHRSWNYITNGFKMNDGSQVPVARKAPRMVGPDGQEIRSIPGL